VRLAQKEGVMKTALRTVLNGIGLVIAIPFIIWGKLGVLFGSERLYVESAYALSIAPGYMGAVIRRAFYWALLPESPWDLGVEFGSVITHADARMSKNVYIGSYCLIGRCRIGSGVLIASRVSVLSGRRQHRLHDEGASYEERFQEITIDQGAWIGEGSVVMANVGKGAIVGAGSVVVKPVPDGATVAGNPAKPLG
jgi:virginiamycin A acetyltransferase